MKNKCVTLLWALVATASLVLTGCGGGGDSAGQGDAGGRSAPTYGVGGIVAGLAEGPLVLSNGIDRFELSFADEPGVVKDRPFAVTHLPAGAAYNVHVEAQPPGVSCTVVNGADVVGSTEVNNIQVLCVAQRSVSLVAGPVPRYGALNGAGAEAGFAALGAITRDAAGNVYAVDQHAIRKITPSGVVSTLAGVIEIPGWADGKGPAARFAHPSWLTTDPQGNVYVADAGNDAIRVVTPAGLVSTLPVNHTQWEGVRAGLPSGCVACGSIARDAAGHLFLSTGFDGRLSIVKLSPPPAQTSSAAADWPVALLRQDDLCGDPDTLFGTCTFTGLVVDSAGAFFVASGTNNGGFSLLKLRPAGAPVTWATVNTSGNTSVIAPAIALAPDGAVWVASSAFPTGERWLHRIDTQTRETATRLSYPAMQKVAQGHDIVALAFDTADHAWVADADVNALIGYTASQGASLVAGRVRQQDNVNAVVASVARFYFHADVDHQLALMPNDDGGMDLVVGDDGNKAIRHILVGGEVRRLWGSVAFVPDGAYNPSSIHSGAVALQPVPGYQLAVDAQKRVYVCKGTPDPFQVRGLFRIQGVDSELALPSASCGDSGLVATVNASDHSRDEIVTVIDGCLRGIATRSGAVGSDGSLSTSPWACVKSSARLSSTLTSIDSFAPLPDGALLVADGSKLVKVAPSGAMSIVRSDLPAGKLFGDGLGHIGLITSTGISVLYGSNLEGANQVIEFGSRTVLGTLPATIERANTAVFRNNQIIVVSGNAVLAIDL
jgi:hypothetical protein